MNKEIKKMVDIENTDKGFQAVLTIDYGDYETKANFRSPKETYDEAYHDVGWLLLENKGSIDLTNDPRIENLCGIRIKKKKGLCQVSLIRRDKRPQHLNPWEDITLAEALVRRMLDANPSLIDMDNVRHGW